MNEAAARARRFMQLTATPLLTRRIAGISFRLADWIARRAYGPDSRENDYEELIVHYDQRLRFHISTASYIEWSILMFGFYEPQIVRLVKRYVPKGGTAIDIGANVGCHTVIMADCAGSGGRVVAFEPHPEVAKRLKDNLTLNTIQNVLVRQQGLTSTAGAAILYARPAGEPMQSISSMFPEHVGQSSRQFEVETSRLDDVANELGIERVDFVKIDTEGSECGVIGGANETIAKFRPVILFEFDLPSWNEAGYDFSFALEYFQRHSYSLFSVANRRLLPISGNISGYANVLALPDPGERSSRSS